MRSRDELIRDSEPFPQNLIKTKPGKFEADYVTWTEYAQRLLLHHGGHRYEVTQLTHGKQVTATKEGPRESYIWSVAVRLYLDEDEWYDAVGEGDTPTSAESNAYKRACAHAGIGLHLYGGFWLHERLKKE